MHKTILLVALLAGCGGTSQEAGVPTSTPGAATPTDLATPNDPTTPAPPTDATLEALIVSTNEPFWQARIDGNTLALTGVDSAERRLSIESSTATADGREVRARDARGMVEAVVSNLPCEDDMSGARFPMTGTLTIDDAGPFHGCARPASMPPPRELADDAPVAVIPERWHGRWAPTEDACRNLDSSIEGITIAASELRFHESIGVPSGIEVISVDTLRLASITKS